MIVRLLLALSFVFLSAQAFAQCKSVPAEIFQDFIDGFSESKTLAMSRTIYPTYTLRHEAGVENGKEIVSAIKTTVSKADDVATPTITQLLARNQLTMRVKNVGNKQATVEVFKPDTDWLLSYHFVERHGCWFLHHVEDHSL